ncbi:lipopolysaccharide biosynthesis protein [Ornithobacterium rhinotracheale]|uniref:lipopolysaccharide biosynthesis protein n=1 Tax=Ornithobacterium rhinotracheale TaxID=28251 RepID=UPI004036EA6C
MSNLDNKIKSGLKWNLFNQVFTQVVFVLFGIYLARLLGPEAYGLVGMVTVFSGVANLLLDFGFTSSIIYFQDLSKKELSSIFWFNLAMALVLYSVLFLCAPLISNFYGEPKLNALAKVISLSLIISALSATQNAQLSRDINFKLKTIYSWIAMFIAYIVAFIMAWCNYGVWSLVAQTLIFSVLNTLGLYSITKWFPAWHFDLADIKKIFHYSFNIFGANSLQYITENVDKLLIGRLAGNDALGLYTRAISLMALPISNISQVFAKVLFPAFSSIKDDISAMQNYYLQTAKVIASLSFPLMFLLFIVSKEFTLIFLGDKWIDLIPILKLFCLLGAFKAIISLNGVLYNSTGNAKLAFRVLIIFNLIQLPIFYICLKYYDFMTMIYAYTVTNTIGAIPILSVALKLIKLEILDIIRKTYVIVIGSIIIVLTGLFIDKLYFESLYTNFILKIMIGAILYSTIMFIFDKKFVLKYLSIKNKI